MRRALISLALLATAHCGPAPGYEVEAPAPAPGSASPVEAVVAPAEETRPGVVIEPAETGCARASRLHAKARALHTAGFVNRPRALVAAAAKLCPEAKLPPLHDSSPPSGDQASLQARLRAATGELPQPLAQGWLRSVEASGGAPRWLAPPTGQVIGISAGFVAVAVGEHGWGRGRGEVALLDFATGAPRYLFDTKQPVAQALVAGDRLLTRHDREVQLWSLADGKPGAKLRWSGERYRAAAFMNGGTQVLVVGESSGRGVLRVFDAASGDSGLDYQDPALGELTQAALVDDHRVVVASFAGAFLVNLKTKQHQPLVGSPSDKSSRDDVTALAVGAGRIATADWQGVVRVFGIDSLREEKRFSATRVSALAFHGADRLVVAGEAGFRGDVRTFDLGTGAAVRARELGGGALALTPDGGAVLVGGHQGPRLEDLEGKARWREPAGPVGIQGAALSHGLLLSREERSGTDTEVVLVGWYRGATLEHRAEGYRAEVLALSPSGRHAAAIVGSDGLWWDLAKNEARPLPRPEARGFPDGLVFDGEARLRLVHERPATTHVIDLPDGSWRAERTPSFDGFRGTALAPSGEAAGLRDDALVLAPDHELAPKGVSGFAFAGNGQRLFAGIDGSLKWFSASGELEGSIPLSCRPGALAVDRSGARVALACGDGLLIADPPGARTVRLVDLPAGERRIERVFLSSDGRRAFAQSGGSLLVVDADAGAWRGTLSLRAGRLVASTADGRLWFEGDSPWAGRDGCQVGHRVFPAAWCADRLMDDLALERWIVGGFD